MSHRWISRVGIVTLVGVMVLSVSLVLMDDSALAEKDDKDSGSATTLRGVTQNWDKSLTSTARFTVLRAFGGAAVRDNNTGLVWEQAPDGTVRNWTSAIGYCVNKNVGGTVGWRLPSVVELKSVPDGSPGAVAPFVPASAFTISTSDVTPVVQSANYWSATTIAFSPTHVWGVFFNSGDVNFNTMDGSNHAWCVRGPMNADQY